MAETFELKKISSDAVDHSLDKAKHYRLLAQPEQAESLCLDILEVEPSNQQTLVVMVLALTDQFGHHGSKGCIRRAKGYVDQIQSEYHKFYYSGIIAEREGRAMLNRGPARSFAYECFREAMDLFEKAEGVRPTNDDDPILRWNSCARTIMNEKLKPQEKEEVGFLE